MPPILLAAGMGEEVGEILHAMRCRMSGGIRGYDNDGKYLDEIGDGIADTFVYAMQLASAHGLDIEDVLEKTFCIVLKRDWKANPETGVADGENSGSDSGSVFER